MAVEPRPHIGYVKQVYFGWVWSGRGIIPAKSVSISIKSVSPHKVIGINTSHSSDEPVFFGSSWLCLNCLVRQDISNVSYLCVIKITKMLSDNMGNNRIHCIQFRSIVSTHRTNNLIEKAHRNLSDNLQRLWLKSIVLVFQSSLTLTGNPHSYLSNHKYFKLANVQNNR